MNLGQVITAMITPFHQDLSVNYEAAAELARKLVDNGNDGLVVAGSTGEAATMSAEEKLRLFETVLEAVGDRATIIAGTGSNDTRASIALTREAEKLGVHGAMLVGPYYNKPPQEGFYQHFKAIAAIIERDVELSYKLLRIANSAYYGTRVQITSIHHALVKLGVQELL